MTALACSFVALLMFPDESLDFLRSLVGGDTRAGNLEGQVNQSLLAAWLRLGGPYQVGLLLAVVVGVSGALIASRWYAVRPPLAVALATVAGLLASPISWDHHFVWVVPLGLALLDRSVPRQIRIIGYAFVAWMGTGLYRVGSPLRGEGRLEFEPWQVVVGSVGPVLAIALLVSAIAVTVPRSLEARTRPATADLPG